MRRLGLVLATVLLLAAACTKDTATPEDTAVVVVNAPFSTAPSVAQPIERGARLAVDQLNAKGGVTVGSSKVKLRIERMDDRGSAAAAAANIKKAAEMKAVAVVAEGTGVDAGWQDAAQAGVPIGIVYQGGEDLVDLAARKNVFRIAPTNRGAAFRLAEYLLPKGLRVALLHDDSPYGAGGGQALGKAFARNRSQVAADLTTSAAPGADPAPDVLKARQSGATALLVWATPQVLAATIRAARSAGWNVPVYASTTGEDPLVRQQLAAHPDWLDGLTFVSSRLTSEKGTAPFEAFRRAYEETYGPEKAGVKSAGKDVVLPPDWAMYSYDFVNVVADAMRRASAAQASAELVTLMEQTEIRGANGDERGFNTKNHEGVVDDDVFFAVFKDMVWQPVKDDPLSATLPAIPQT
ncbi:MAG TPA: ABC transporter substrate-binding protein [Acidimicrobiales bacterium]|nr:ABC transporter substrate-binding protein [Acidimicrobiales bacterium]